MKLKQHLLAGVFVLAPFCTNAADLPRKAPAYIPPPVFSWTGFYVGVSAGGIGQNTKTIDIGNAFGGVFGAPSTHSVSGIGFIGGANIGYNYQFAQNWVIGLEGDISGTSLDDTGFEDRFGNRITSELNALATVRARIGYSFDRALLYATGGWAYGHVKNAAINGFAPILSVSTDGWQSGWTAGAGLEYAFLPNWTVRVEGLYVDLGDTTTDPNIGGCRVGFDNRYLIARLGLNYKF